MESQIIIAYYSDSSDIFCKQPDGLTQPLDAGLDGGLIDAGEIQAKGR